MHISFPKPEIKRRIEENQKEVHEDIANQAKMLEKLRRDIAFLIRSRVQKFEAETFKEPLQSRLPARSVYEASPAPNLNQSLSQQVLRVYQPKGDDFTRTIRERFLKPKGMEPLYRELFDVFAEDDAQKVFLFLRDHPELVDRQIYGMTMLYRMVKLQNVKMVEILVGFGANPHLLQEVFHCNMARSGPLEG